MTRSSNIVMLFALLLWLSCAASTRGQQVRPSGAYQTDPKTLTEASTDFGRIVHKTPSLVLEPSSVSDISDLIKQSNSRDAPFTVAARGRGHSLMGQAMADGGVVVNMTELNRFRNGSGIVIACGNGGAGGDCYADVGGEQLWIDVLHACLQRGLTPLSWTDYLYLTVGGTLSNAGVSGQTFRFGPQISNVLELDVVTGNGDLVTCSPDNNPEIYYAVLGGLGQFGVITRARILLGPAPTRAKWLRLIYTDFSAFSGDQEHLISFSEKSDTSAADYVEGMLLLNQQPLELSFFPTADQPRITSLVTQYGITYVIELVKYYDNNTQAHINEDVANLVKGLKFVPTFMFEKDVSYEDFLNRVRPNELALRSQGLWDVPHPWLNIYIPKSGILDFNEGVFKGIILKQNITTGITLLFPMNRNKWDDRMSAIIPDEDVFYIVGFLHTVANGGDELQKYQAQNQEIVEFCKNSGIKSKEYLTGNKTHEEWVEHFGAKWKLWQDRKAAFDPKRILSPGQGIF